MRGRGRALANGLATGIRAGFTAEGGRGDVVRGPAGAARPRREAPAVPDGAGLVLVMNAASGTSSEELAGFLAAELPQARVARAGKGSACRRSPGSTTCRIPHGSRRTGTGSCASR